MTNATKRYDIQPAGSRRDYAVNQFATTTQITVGGRSTGSVIIRYRPTLDLKPTIDLTDFESPADNSINFAVDGQGVKKHTFTIDGTLLSYIEVDDSGNGGLGDFWVHITQC